ncbi:branched-chain amino acid ABC transporter permease [Pigmentiphaga sp. NML030171]|uniref:branched-chain amino acid ABC transporter permease n=1 Tax=Pigmentiphaga sp. NML030171 TaxID=2008676 RepID=UPI000B4156F6|nr:branched-chain amino acid ABC transporter permease [Pigmentiphaga sp. NML030171]OVZ66562.1 branched-chain amino acid ABC transporter permease [Pigmentiphaga sp. NML030171]
MAPLDQILGRRTGAILLALAVAFPLGADWLGQGFYVDLAARIMIFALAATSLNLVMGFGGMVCFGHAAFLGIGAYTVAILMDAGVDAAWIAWPAATAAAALAAWLIGVVSLRTRGVYFIMITLAFAQMLYYVFVSLNAYGGDDGMPLPTRSVLPFGLDASSDLTFYYVVLAILAVAMWLMQRLVNARFGRALQAIRENETRMEAIGYPVFRIKLAAFVIAGGAAGLAGALVANQAGMVSPGLMYWTQSGSLMIMVILGGVGYLYGGVVGAALLLAAEEYLSGLTLYWQLPLGILLLAAVLYARNGALSLATRWRHG